MGNQSLAVKTVIINNKRFSAGELRETFREKGDKSRYPSKHIISDAIQYSELWTTMEYVDGGQDDEDPVELSFFSFYIDRLKLLETKDILEAELVNGERIILNDTMSNMAVAEQFVLTIGENNEETNKVKSMQIAADGDNYTKFIVVLAVLNYKDNNINSEEASEEKASKEKAGQA